MWDFRFMPSTRSNFFVVHFRLIFIVFGLIKPGMKLKVTKHSFQVPRPNSQLLLNYLCFGARQESRLRWLDRLKNEDIHQNYGVFENTIFKALEHL